MYVNSTCLKLIKVVNFTSGTNVRHYSSPCRGSRARRDQQLPPPPPPSLTLHDTQAGTPKILQQDALVVVVVAGT